MALKNNAAAPNPRHTLLLVATRKGAWLYHGDPARANWHTDGPHFLGHIISHMVLDPRDGRTLLAAAKTGHLGPTIFRSTDLGRNWKEAARPPAFATVADGSGRAVDHTFWLTPGHANEADVWYAGSSPQGLFRSEDGGVSWAPFSNINEDPNYRKWMGTVQDGTPDGPKLHSIIVDPRDAAHLYFAMSGGGVHESTDGGESFAPIVDGLEVVEGFDRNDIAFHDPHCVRLCPSNPDRLYQQNHCGIYRLDRPSRQWRRIGKNMPQQVGDIGFPLVLHPRDADTAWVFPMDGTEVWPRTSPDGKPAVYATR
ncbi:MAG: glycosyl hydrolase, partial [Sulfuritalea sp.]|nr:glycosyl hydrolase [Sulfuritalea sp.]